MFNEDQAANMRELATIPPGEKHWCGWYTLKETPVCYTGCPVGFTARDKLNMRCEACGNEPWIDGGGRLVHLHGCTPAFRADHFAAFDLGGEA